MGHFLSNTEYNAQLNPAEMVHMSPLPSRTEMSVDRFPLTTINIKPVNEIIMPTACLSVICSLNPIQETNTINIGIIEFIKTVFVTVDDFRAMYINMLKLVTDRIASNVRIFQFRRIKSLWCTICLREKGRIINNATAQRQNARVMGGISL